MGSLTYISALTIALCASSYAGSGKEEASATTPTSWKDHTISPVASLICFEDPIIRNELRPAFIYHRMDDGFITGGGDAYLTGVQLRLALTDRLQFIVNKGGYAWINPNPNVKGKSDGWANVVTGLKYVLVDSEQDQLILTPGISYELPFGDEAIYHGTGDGIINIFASAMKGFGDFHLTGYAGYQQAVDTAASSSLLQFNLQADYWVHRYFIPFIAVSSWTVTQAGSAFPLSSEGYDLINFGSSGAKGTTQATVGIGFRSRIQENVDLGIAYQKAVASPEGLFDDRITFDISYRW
jgi:hypothetical protein